MTSVIVSELSRGAGQTMQSEVSVSLAIHIEGLRCPSLRHGGHTTPAARRKPPGRYSGPPGGRYRMLADSGRCVSDHRCVPS